MKLNGGVGSGRKVVVVGVKLEHRSRELLTWTLMKIAQPGDLVIALHVVLHSSSGEQSSLISLVKAFDYALAVYQGFCHLKQVELKLKVCKGSSVCKALIEEAKMYYGATVILGVSKNHLLPTSIAKHCARKLSHIFPVVAVQNGRIVFHRKATISDTGICRMRSSSSSGDYLALSDVIKKGMESYLDNANTLNKQVSGSTRTFMNRFFGCGRTLKWPPKARMYQMETKPCIDQEGDKFFVHGMERYGKELDALGAKYSCMCTLFKYKELLSATSGFLPERMIGRGGSSRVYKGRLCDGKEVAVKILKSSEEMFKEFSAEIEIITSISHKNIVTLLGFCIDYETPILVYDLLPRGSLEQNLHGHKKGMVSFGWEERYNVALGLAKALVHLHSRSSEPVIHRDVKSSNILLDEDFEPQLADFGLAIWTSTASYATCSGLAGTFGYLAPEYFMQGKVTEKIDVYAFGVVILELLSGRKPIDDNKSLVMWADPILKSRKLSQLVDASLGYDHCVIERMALAATLCIRRAPLRRPRISIVLKILRGDTKVTKWAKQKVKSCIEFDMLDGEASSKDIQSHLNTVLLDLEDDTSFTSENQLSVVVDDYLKGTWSRFPSFS